MSLPTVFLLRHEELDYNPEGQTITNISRFLYKLINTSKKYRFYN